MMKKNIFKGNNLLNNLILAIIVFVFCFAILPAGASDKGNVKDGDNQSKCYKILSGKENKMCPLFQQNLNRFCKQTFVCETPIHPDFAKYFSVPKWEIVDYKSHLGVIEQYIKIRAIIPIKCSGQCVTDVREKKWQEYKSELFKRLETGKIKLVRARIKIKYDYDGKSKIAYRLVDTVCSPDDLENYQISRKPGLMIIDEDTGKPNEYFTTGFNSIVSNNVFLYQGYAYLIDLDDLPYSPALYSRNSIECHYEHIDRNEGGKK